MADRTLKLVYPDTALLGYLTGDRKPEPKRIVNAIREGKISLCISWLHLMECAKSGNSERLRRWGDYFETLEPTRQVRWVAHHDLLIEREIGHYASTILAPKDERLFVPTIGHLFSRTIGSAQEAVLFRTPREYAALMTDQASRQTNSRLDAYNAVIDGFKQRFAKSRALLQKWKFPLIAPITQILLETLRTNVAEVPSIVGRMEKMNLAQFRDAFPFIWMRYELEIAHVKAKTTFTEGDARDIFHAAYLPYVDRITVDKTFLKTVMRLKVAQEWSHRVTKNGDVIRDIVDLA